MDMCYLACAYRTPSGYCGSTGGAATCPHRKKPITNADRIRAMTDEELAEWIRDQIIDRNIGIPSETWLDWLKEEVKE